ncbi:MAG: NAD-dependent epimerase/dehydratase family protein [Candidatus Sericytochromatia bacterium]
MRSFAEKTILITGGAGFVGSNLVKELLKQDIKSMTVVDNLLSSEAENLPPDPRLIFLQGSISDDAILAKIEDQFDFIFHLATYHGNQSSIHDPLKDHENNTLTTLKLYEHIKNFKKLDTVIYSSAGCVVAEKTFDNATATQEDASISPYMDSPYQISKIIGEFYSNYYFKQWQLPVVKARFQNVYGPGEVLGAGAWRGTPATVWRNVTPTFIYKSLKNQALTVENGGIATRDFIYVTDIVNGLMLCALKGTPGDVYNLASGIEISILELANKINHLTGNVTPLDFYPKRHWDNSGKRFGSTDKAEKTLGFKAEVDLEVGLKQTIKWTQENLDFIQKCMDKHLKYLTS